MFENISKGKVSSFGRTVYTKDKPICNTDYDNGISDAEFISFCFNLQQRYDISKLEEAVEILEDHKDLNPSDRRLEQLLKQIKK